MPPDSNTKRFKAGLNEIKARFKEFDKLQQKQWKTRNKQMRVEKKYQRDEMKSIERAQKVRERALKNEIRIKERAREKERRQFKQIAREKQRIVAQKANFERRERAKRRREDRKYGPSGPSGPSGPYGGGGGSGGGGDSRRSFGQRAGGMVKGAAYTAAGGLIGLMLGMYIRGYKNYITANKAMSPMIGSGGTYGHASRGSRKGNLGFNIAERAQLIPAMARSTGQASPGAMMEAMRATGMGSGEVGGIFSALAQGGAKFDGKGDNKGKREFKEIIAAGLASGLERGRLPEFFQGVTSLMQQQQSMMTGDVGQGNFSKFLGMLGRTGLAGFKGARGAAVANKLHQGIIKPGGGEIGNAFMMQSMGFGKPGGTRSWYAARGKMQKGLSDPTNFEDAMSHNKAMYGTGEDAATNLEQIFGISQDQAEQLIRLHDSSMSMDEKMAEVATVMDESKSLEQQAVDQMRKAGTNLSRIAKMFDLSVGDGAKARKAIEAMEDLQRDVFERIHGVLVQIKNFVQSIYNFIQNPTRTVLNADDDDSGSPVGANWFSDAIGMTGWSGKQKAGHALSKSRHAATQRMQRNLLKYGKKARAKSGDGTPYGEFELYTEAANATKYAREQYLNTGEGSSEDVKYREHMAAAVSRGSKAMFAARFIPDFYQAAGITNPTAEDQAAAKAAMNKAANKATRRDLNGFRLTDENQAAGLAAAAAAAYKKKKAAKGVKGAKGTAAGATGPKTGSMLPSSPIGTAVASSSTNGVDVNANIRIIQPPGVNIVSGSSISPDGRGSSVG